MPGELVSWLSGKTNCRMIELTNHSIGKFGTIWRRLGKLCGWCRCVGEIVPCANGALYWRLSCRTFESGIVVDGGWSRVPNHPSIDDIFETFVDFLFISHNGGLFNTFDRIEFFLKTPTFKNLVSDSVPELELKLTLFGV